jgi:hypothetical protein
LAGNPAAGAVAVAAGTAEGAAVLGRVHAVPGRYEDHAPAVGAGTETEAAGPTGRSCAHTETPPIGARSSATNVIRPGK